jgi:hypothetical protein
MRRRLFISVLVGLVLLIVAIVLGVGLGVGLGKHDHRETMHPGGIPRYAAIKPPIGSIVSVLTEVAPVLRHRRRQ